MEYRGYTIYVDYLDGIYYTEGQRFMEKSFRSYSYSGICRMIDEHLDSKTED